MNDTARSLPDPLPADPMPLAAAWLKEAWEKRVQPNPDAMVIATVDGNGNPSARVVLCKGIVAEPGFLLFYTNYRSRKGQEIAAQPRGAAVLFWDTLNRQARIEGPIVKAPREDSDAYFATRPWQRRVGAWASQQSQPIESRAALIEAVKQAGARFGITPAQLESPGDIGQPVQIPRPPHWGGYQLWAEAVELWVQGDYRIHDRARWTRKLERIDQSHFAGGNWSAARLQP